MTSNEFTTALKSAINDVVIPACKEEIRRLMEDEKEYLYRQFCETRHVKTIDILQRALAAVVAAKEELSPKP